MGPTRQHARVVKVHLCFRVRTQITWQLTLELPGCTSFMQHAVERDPLSSLS